jgi:hypothetical protein
MAEAIRWPAMKVRVVGVRGGLRGAARRDPRTQTLNLQLCEEWNQRMRAHLHNRWQVELDQRLALIRRELETISVPRGVGQVLGTHVRIMSEAVQRRRQPHQFGLDRGIMRRAALLPSPPTQASDA